MSKHRSSGTDVACWVGPEQAVVWEQFCRIYENEKKREKRAGIICALFTGVKVCVSVPLHCHRDNPVISAHKSHGFSIEKNVEHFFK